MPCGGNAVEKCGGSCSLTMWRVECSSNWGWALLLTLFLCSVAYVGGFVGYNHKALGKPLGTEALPHPEFWVAGYGLAVDGAVFFSGVYGSPRCSAIACFTRSEKKTAPSTASP